MMCCPHNIVNALYSYGHLSIFVTEPTPSKILDASPSCAGHADLDVHRCQSPKIFVSSAIVFVAEVWVIQVPPRFTQR